MNTTGTLATKYSPSRETNKSSKLNFYNFKTTLLLEFYNYLLPRYIFHRLADGHSYPYVTQGKI